jgi:uncharacterized protein (DUF1778 family)
MGAIDGRLNLHGKLPYCLMHETFHCTTRSPDQPRVARHTLKHAAEIQGRSMAYFVASVVQEAAERVIEQAEIIWLSLADQECFAKALLSPLALTPSLKRAFKRHGELVQMS